MKSAAYHFEVSLLTDALQQPTSRLSNKQSYTQYDVAQQHICISYAQMLTVTYMHSEKGKVYQYHKSQSSWV